MIKRLALSFFALSLMACGACAQAIDPGTNPSPGAPPWAVIPTAPPGTNTNQAASTAFVGAALANILATPNAWTALQTFQGTVSAGGDVSNGANGTWNDRTSIIGTANTTLESFYSPFYYGNPGTGIVDRMNRVFIGAPAASIANGGTSNDILSSTGLPTSPGWMDTLIGLPVVGVSQLAVGSTFGALAVTGYCRTSDHEGPFGTPTQGCQGGTFFAYNNDSGNAIGVGSFSFAARASGAGGVTAGAQLDISNKGSVIDLTPTGTVTGGVNFGALITSGAFASISNANVTAAIVIDNGRTSGPTFRKGIEFMSTAFDTSVGLGGGGIAEELYCGQSIRGLNASNVSVFEMWGNCGGGLILNGAFVSLGGVIIDTAAPTAGAGEKGFGGTTAATTNCGSLASAVACVVINVAGTTHYVPYY